MKNYSFWIDSKNEVVKIFFMKNKVLSCVNFIGIVFLVHKTPKILTIFQISIVIIVWILLIL